MEPDDRHHPERLAGLAARVGYTAHIHAAASVLHSGTATGGG